MTSGERRVAQRLEDKLDDDYLLWYDVPMGPRYAHPDFCVMHPRRGILVLEVKDWKLSTIQQADKQTWEIIPDGIPLVKPISCARKRRAHKEGHSCGDMAIFCPDYSTRDLCAQVLHQRQIPVEMRRSPGDACYAEAGDWAWWLWQQTRITISKSRHLCVAILLARHSKWRDTGSLLPKT